MQAGTGPRPAILLVATPAASAASLWVPERGHQGSRCCFRVAVVGSPAQPPWQKTGPGHWEAMSQFGPAWPWACPRCLRPVPLGHSCVGAGGAGGAVGAGDEELAFLCTPHGHIESPGDTVVPAGQWALIAITAC